MSNYKLGGNECLNIKRKIWENQSFIIFEKIALAAPS